MTDFAGLIQTLCGAKVDFVGGGFAGTLHGSTVPTRALDVVYSRAPENIERLVAALRSCTPYLRGAPPGLPFRWDAATVKAGLNFTLITDLGAIDLLGEIAVETVSRRCGLMPSASDCSASSVSVSAWRS